eukprot:GHUV01009638.1.p1 GENE.GHUV01009638.1~~GHUV01009638.1.p1  ORF type:complete len:439 (+),score=125.06 GHUV01009638.1:149-1465(+)
MTEPVSAAHGQGELPTGEPFTEADEVLIPSTSAQSSRAGGSSVLRLRGLPFASTESDIISFFAGYEIHEVYICRRDGRSTGEAYVVLSSPEDASTALSSLNKQYMGNRYIELFEAAQADLAAVKKVLEDSRLQGFVVRLRGLPYSATAADIAQFFSGVQIAQDEDAIVFAQSVDGRPTGEAYVELTDEQALSLAMTWHKELMGSRYIEIFNSSKVDKLQALQQSRFHVQSSQNRRARWPMLPAAAAVAAGVHLGQMSAAPLVGLPNPDQLADSLAAARINPAAAAASSSAGTLPGVVAAGPFAVPAGVTMLSNCYTINPAAVTADAAGFITAAAAAGRRPSDVVLSPAAAPGAAPAARPYQVAPQGPMLLGPDGQPQPVYYMHPAQVQSQHFKCTWHTATFSGRQVNCLLARMVTEACHLLGQPFGRSISCQASLMTC